MKRGLLKIIILSALTLSLFATVVGCDNTFKVTYDFGTSQVTVEVKKGETAEEKSAFAPEGYEFEYWYEEDENVRFDFNTPIEGDKTLHAKFKDTTLNYTIDFYTERGAAPVNSITKKYNSFLDYADVFSFDVTKPNYNFLYWATEDGDKFEPGVRVTGDIDLYAVYEIKKLPVVYYGRDGRVLKNETVDALTESTAPEAPQIDNFEFSHFDDHSSISEDMLVDGVVPIYAHYYAIEGTFDGTGAVFTYKLNKEKTGYEIGLYELKNRGTANNTADVVLPETIVIEPTDVALPCLKLLNEAFYTKRVASLEIPDSYVEIGASAFAGCTTLQTLTISPNSSLEVIGEYAFDGCTSLSGTLRIPKKLTRLNSFCFRNCKNLTNVETEGAYALKYINEEAFLSSGIQTMDFGQLIGLESIGTAAFYATNIKTLNFSNCNSLRTINDRAFYGTANCTKIIFPQRGVLETIGVYAFFSTGADELNLPDSIREIRQGAFDIGNQSKGPVSISLPSTVEIIAAAAFKNDRYGRLEKITVRGTGGNYYSVDDVCLIRRGTDGDTFMLYAAAAPRRAFTTPANIKDFWRFCFANCVNLEELTITEGPTSIPVCFAANMLQSGAPSKLTTVRIPASVESVCNDDNSDVIVWGAFSTSVRGSFYGCTSLKTVTFAPDSKLNILGAKAFADSSLSEIVLPAKLSIIGDKAFNNTKITKYAIETDNETYTVYNGMLFNADGTVLISYPYNGPSEVIIPSSVKRVATNAFPSLTQIEKITFETDENGNGVEVLEDDSFHGYEWLEHLTLPDSLKEIGNNVFTGTYVIDLVIPRSVTKIGDGCFMNMPLLNSVTFLGNPALGEGCFQLTKRLSSVRVPKVYYDYWLKNPYNDMFARYLDCIEDLGITYTFDALEGKFDDQTSVSVVKSAFVKSYPIPTADGKYFAGWYTKNGTEDGDWGKRLTMVGYHSAPGEEQRFYAKWSDVKIVDGVAAETAYDIEVQKQFTVDKYAFGNNIVSKFQVPSFGYYGYSISIRYRFSFSYAIFSDGSLSGDTMCETDEYGRFLLETDRTYYFAIYDVVSPVYTNNGAKVFADGEILDQPLIFTIA